jgi:protease-4
MSRLLQSLNIKADVFNREEYKSALRNLVDTGHSKAHRKAIGGLLASLMSQIIGGVAKDRGLEGYQVYLSRPICFSSL